MSQINPQRSQNYWEPIYKPGIEAFNNWNPADTQNRNVTGIAGVIINIGNYKSRKKLEDFSFKEIDFHGSLDGNTTKFTFRKCKFERCSFRGTKWLNIKFTDCQFTLTTFSLSEFNQCEFRGCKFENIGVSGNTTRLIDVYLEPDRFLKNVYLNKNKAVLKENQTTLLHQWYRSSKTKSEIARKLTKMRSIKADYGLNIRSIRTARYYEIESRLREAWYFMVKGDFKRKLASVVHLVTGLIEYLITFFFGWLSGWGQKIGRAISIGVVAIMMFSVFYNKTIMIGDPFGKCILKSCEYWFLFGYTKYSFKSMQLMEQIIVFCNSLFGMLWFAAIIPVIINKMSQIDD